MKTKNTITPPIRNRYATRFRRSLCRLLCLALLLASCSDDPLPGSRSGQPMQVEEGIEGTLSFALSHNDFEQRVSAVTRADMDAEWSEQHIHSVYVFVVKKVSGNPEECPVIARKYFPDVTEHVKQITLNGQSLQVVELSMKAISCQTAEIFAIGNLGYSDLQHIDNDDELLVACDNTKTQADLKSLTARLSVSDDNQVRVERTQGHLLMSGFFEDCSESGKVHYLNGSNQQLTLQAEGDGTIGLYDAEAENGPRRFTPLGADGGNPGAIVLQRLDSKITFEIEPAGDLARTEGAFFRLTSWQVINAPTEEPVSWYREEPISTVKDSKVFQRDISQTLTGGYTFTFYQFENCKYPARDNGAEDNGYLTLDKATIVAQYNLQHRGEDINEQTIIDAIGQGYPNAYTNFAYSLRARKEKHTAAGPYQPGEDEEADKTISVTNGDWQFAPSTATYVLLKGVYFNPKEPVRRRADDPRNQDFTESLATHPYWNVDNRPVATAEEAAKRTRTAEVSYAVHLGYVGGGNYKRDMTPVPARITTFDEYLQKVNDYNVLRNHHYTYKIGISGVNNIKVEATREDGGNIYEQEKQPGAEGFVMESQHLYSLDAHYETRNLTIDFARMPEHFKSYSFRVQTNFETSVAYMKDKADGSYGIFDGAGREITDIRGHDLDWIHFAWHGTEDDPSHSLIDAQTGNGISYSQTYGGYTTQQTYNDPDKQLTREQDDDHPYRLMNSCEFVLHVWEYYQRWKAAGKPDETRTVTYTIFVDENYYDLNPVTGANVDWVNFCSTDSRSVSYFMEDLETGADGNSKYTDAHVIINQLSIQTPYATSTAGGQTIADVAFGIEHLDEFHSKYVNTTNSADHYLAGTQSTANGLYNTMRWYYYFKKNNQSEKIITWQDAEKYYNDKERARAWKGQEAYDDGLRSNRRASWAVYSRNRDLNRDNQIQPDEVRWFIPTIQQYTICFLAGRAAFEHPLYERDQSHFLNDDNFGFLKQLPFLHFLSNTSQVFWSEEGCSVSTFGQSVLAATRCYSIRMARMLTNHGRVSTGKAIVSDNANQYSVLLHDPLYIISERRNGAAITDKNLLVDGKNYYVTLNKINPTAFRDFVQKGDLAQHDHEQPNNWLYREFKIARNKIGFTSYTNWKVYDRTPKIDGEARTWWQLNGVWTNRTDQDYAYFYDGPTTSIAWNYTEDTGGKDLHRWRVPNLRETAIMSLVFSSQWFDGNYITARTKSANLGPKSGSVPYFRIESGIVKRLDGSTTLMIRPVHDVQAGD